MTLSRQEYVVGFWNKSCSPAPTTPLRSAIAGGLLSCLAFDEILKLLLDDRALDGRLHKKALGRIASAFDELRPAARSKAAMRLLQLANATPYPRRLTVEYLLELLYKQVPSPTRRVILRTFLQSRSRSRRKRAYGMMRGDRGSGWKPMLIEAWRTWHDLDAALLIVDQFESAFLVEHVNELASVLDGSAGMSRLFLRVASERPPILARLKNRDGVTYAYICARLSKRLSSRAATNLLKEYKNDARLGILAWSLGKLGHWSLLVKLSEEVEDLENKQKQAQYKRMGFSPETIRLLTVARRQRSLISA